MLSRNQVYLATINIVSLAHVMLNFASWGKKTSAVPVLSRSYDRAAGFPLFSLFIFSYKAAVNLHSWNHFPVLKKLPFSKYMSTGLGNVQHAFSPDFLVVWASLKSHIFYLLLPFFFLLLSTVVFLFFLFFTRGTVSWMFLVYWGKWGIGMCLPETWVLKFKTQKRILV